MLFSYSCKDRMLFSCSCKDRMLFSYSCKDRMLFSYSCKDRMLFSYSCKDRMLFSYSCKDRMLFSYSCKDRAPCTPLKLNMKSRAQLNHKFLPRWLTLEYDCIDILKRWCYTRQCFMHCSLCCNDLTYNSSVLKHYETSCRKQCLKICCHIAGVIAESRTDFNFCNDCGNTVTCFPKCCIV